MSLWGGFRPTVSSSTANYEDRPERGTPHGTQRSRLRLTFGMPSLGGAQEKGKGLKRALGLPGKGPL